MKTGQEFNRTETGPEALIPILPPPWYSFTDHSPLATLAAEGPTHIVRYANPAFHRLAGSTNEELIGHPFAEAVPEGARNGCLALLDRVYLQGEAETLIDQEHTSSLRSGVCWSYTAWAIRKEAEPPTGVMVQVADTTAIAFLREQALKITEAIMVAAVRQHEHIEQVEAGERRIHQAMRETDHRMKNHLQSVCALLDIQVMENAEAVPVGELIQIRSQIKTLATIHDLLTQDVTRDTAASILSVNQMLQKLLPMLQQVVGIEPIRWSAAESCLPIKQGVALAIIINELVTNAVKHGARTVEMQVTTFEETMTLLVCDDGPGFPEGFDPRIAGNFGMELVESVSRLELSGHITFENRPDGGACVAIVFPIPTLADPISIIY